jgi:hypothetical protein
VRPAAGSSSNSTCGSSASARDFEQTLLAVRQIARLFRRDVLQTDEAQHAERALACRAFFMTITRRHQADIGEVRAERMMQTDQYIFERGHFAEQLHVLERARDARQRNRSRRAPCNRFAAILDRARRRYIDARQHVHHRALA